MEKLTLATAEKCFQDNKLVKGKGEVNYTQFLQWMTGQSLMDDDQMEALEQYSKPTKKSDFSQRKFKNTQDFVRGFMQEQEFVDVIQEMQRDSMLSGVRLFVIMIEFKKYQRSNNITADQFKTSFRKVV